MKALQTFSTDGRATIVLIDEDGDVATVTETHPNFTRISQAVKYGEDPSEWLNPTTDWFEAKYLDNSDDDICVECDEYLDDCVCDDVNVDDYDPTEVVESLSATIERYRREGRDASNLVRFMHRLERNPSRRSREQLFNWTQAKDLTIDADGYIIGFKGVRSRYSDQDFLDAAGNPLFPLDRYPYASCASGHGIVDGFEVNGNLPMGVGVVVEMPREEVQDDPNQACSHGLHVGTHDYAVGYSHSGALLEVRFDPADVVSVPADSGFAKLRCCRYTGVAVHEADGDLSAWEPDATWDEVEALDDILESAPKHFGARLLARIRGNKDKS